MIVTSTDTGLNHMLNGNYFSEIFILRSSIHVYLRHANSPAGINFLDLLNLIPIIMVKRKAETVKDNSIYLCSHFSQWTVQEHGELSKVIAMFCYELQFKKIIRSERGSIKHSCFAKNTAMISFSYKYVLPVQQNAKLYSTGTK